MELVTSQVNDKTLMPKTRTALLRRILSPAPEFKFCQPANKNRHLTEEYIESTFKAAYAAQVSEFLPILLVMKCLGNISGVAGIRPAEKNKLFLEQYLVNNIEGEISEKAQMEVERKSIVEIGNLVATAKGASHIIFLIFTSVLLEAGYDWITFSATQALQNNLKKLGYNFFPICIADPKSLTDSSKEQWGSYYESNPVVVAGSLKSAMMVVENSPIFHHIKIHYKDKITSLAVELSKSVKK